MGNYSLSGNALLQVQGSDYYCFMGVGCSGTGTFTQTGGIVSVSDYNGGVLSIGAATGGVGSYSLSGNGQLSVTGDARGGNEYVGASGKGTFVQMGGSNTTNGALYIGQSNVGTYSLSGNGYLSAPTENIGVSASGSFTQSGGTNSVSASLTLGTNSGGTGAYSLSGGVLTGPAETVGNGSTAAGLFQQTGGLNNAATLAIAASGVYQLHGGTLQVNGDLTNSGVLDGGNTSAVLSIVASAIADFSSGTLQNTGSTTVIGGPFTLMNFPAGFNTATAFGSYTTAGVTHIIGTPLNVPAGKGFIGSILISDLVTCQGSIIVNPGGAITLSNGLVISGTGTVNLGNGNLTNNDTSSGMSGGSTLTLQSQYVGESGVGTFTQTGGTSSMLSITVGDAPGSSGTYILSGGAQLNAIEETFGNSGSGSITQTGGKNTVISDEVSFNVGYNPGSYGSYTLGGSGQLNVQGMAIGAFEQIGGSGVGVFTQSGGTNSTYTVTSWRLFR